MDGEARAAAVAALDVLAGSADYLDRTDAGRGLASFAEMSVARERLLKLVLDPDDTFVTLRTAEALLRRKDAVGLAIVVAALAEADECHSGWIGSAVDDVFQVFAYERDAALQHCHALAEGGDERMRFGAAEMIDILSKIRPLLYPA